MLFCLAVGLMAQTVTQGQEAASVCVFACVCPVGDVTEGEKRPQIVCGDVTSALLFVCMCLHCDSCCVFQWLCVCRPFESPLFR